ncbi:MAG: hypothetical protein MI975_26645 [Cytophagales bacterium]|nr:hypothetical protein [Cytophagales bacterium]
MDSRSPGKDLWSQIEQELASDKKMRRVSGPVFYWRAAAVMLLLISSWLVFDKVSQNADTRNDPALSALSPKLLEAESFYISLIDQKRGELEVLGEKYELGSEFLNEIDRLDSLYSLLKQDMARGNQENLVDAMILNLQLRIEILNQQLSIIQSIENSEKDEQVIL